MVVIAIIGILAAVTVPSISAISNKNKDTQRIEHMKAVDKAIRTCYALEGKYPESIEYLRENKYVLIDTEKYIYRYELEEDGYTFGNLPSCAAGSEEHEEHEEAAYKDRGVYRIEIYYRD